MVFKLSFMGTQEPKVCQKRIRHIIITTQPTRTSDARQVDPIFWVVSECTLWISQLKLELIGKGVIFARMLSSFGFGKLVWIVASVSYLGDGISDTLVETSDWLSYCCLAILNYSAHSPVTSDIFFPTQLAFTGYFVRFEPFGARSP